MTYTGMVTCRHKETLHTQTHTWETIETQTHTLTYTHTNIHTHRHTKTLHNMIYFVTQTDLNTQHTHSDTDSQNIHTVYTYICKFHIVFLELVIIAIVYTKCL